MKKLISYSILLFIILACLLLFLEVIFFLGLFVGIFPFLGHWIKVGIINNDISYSYFFLSFILFFAYLALKKGKVLLFNLSFIMFILGATEKYLVLNKPLPPTQNTFVDSQGWYLRSDTFGFRAAKNFTDHSKSYYDSILLFDVHYNTDEYGLRKTPEINAGKLTKSIVFFGCSFTFGTGLNDDEVMPNIVQNSVQNRFRVYNFGFGGYGTQQMLTSIEYNIVDSIVKYDPEIFIYSVIPDHVNRLIGLVEYGGRSQRYILDPETKEVKRVGHIKENNVTLFSSKIIKSEIYNLFKKKKANVSDVNLFVKVVEKSQKMLKQKYPDSKFHVIFWDYPVDETCTLMLNGLKNAHIVTHRVSDIIPDYSRSLKKYWVKYPFEGHPNGITNKKIADYVVSNILHLSKEIEYKSEEITAKL